MVRLLISIVIALCLVVPAAALAGNTAPKLYLEVWQFDPEQVPDPMPTEVCVHLTKPVGGIQCYSTKAAYYQGVVALHVGNLNQPPCPTVGLDCKTPISYGGYLGVGFGMSTSGEAVSFASWTPCPGFLKGPSSAGEPAAILAGSISGCHDWWDHLGYLTYLNLSTRTGTTLFAIIPSADLQGYDVINCHNEYDDGTEIGGGAQWGGVQTLTCSTTPVEDTTWGRLKTLYR